MSDLCSIKAKGVVWSICRHAGCTAADREAGRACHARTQSTWVAPGSLPNAPAWGSPLTRPHTPGQHSTALSNKTLLPGHDH